MDKQQILKDLSRYRRLQEKQPEKDYSRVIRQLRKRLLEQKDQEYEGGEKSVILEKRS